MAIKLNLAHKLPEVNVKDLISWSNAFGQPDHILRPVFNKHDKEDTIRADVEEFLRDPVTMFYDCNKSLGSGCYGSASETRRGNVLKKFSMRDGYGLWACFAAWAYRRGSGCSQLPRIYAVALPEDAKATDGYGFLLMEKLTYYCDPDVDGRDIELDRSSYKLRDGLVGITNRVQYGEVVAPQTPIEKLWVEFVVTMRRKGINISCDMHMGNYLYRDANTDKEVGVVVDPATVQDMPSFELCYVTMRDFLQMIDHYQPRFSATLRSVTHVKSIIN